MEENWTLAFWGRALPRSRRFQVGGSQARHWALAAHDPGAKRLPGRQAGTSGRRLSARRCQGSGVDRPAGQDDEVKSRDGSPTRQPPSQFGMVVACSCVVPSDQAGPDPGFQKAEKAEDAERKGAQSAQVRAERRSHASDLRAAALLWYGA